MEDTSPPVQRRESPIHKLGSTLVQVVTEVVNAVRHSGVLSSEWQIGFSIDEAIDDDSPHNGFFLRLVVVPIDVYEAAASRQPGSGPGAPASYSFPFNVGAQSNVVYYIDTYGIAKAKCTWNQSAPASGGLGNRSGQFLMYLQLYISIRLNVGTFNCNTADFTLENMTDEPGRAARPGGIYGHLVPDQRSEGRRAFRGITSLDQQLLVSAGDMRLPVHGGLSREMKKDFVSLGEKIRTESPPWSEQASARFRTLGSFLFDQYQGGRRRKIMKRRKTTKRSKTIARRGRAKPGLKRKTAKRS